MKRLSILVLAFALSSILLVTPMKVKANDYPPGDLNHDGYVTLEDLVMMALAYGSHAGPPPDPNWNPEADLAAPFDVISLTDLVTMGYYYNPPPP